MLNAFQSNLVFFYSPTQVAAKEAPAGRTFRVGGMVKAGSVKRNGTEVQFTVTDTAQTMPVGMSGILPDLFKEGKGVVAQGQVGADGVFVAREVLAKHDENYMPPEAAEALKRGAAANEKIAEFGGRRHASDSRTWSTGLAAGPGCGAGAGHAAAGRRGPRSAPTGWRWPGRRRRCSSCWCAGFRLPDGGLRAATTSRCSTWRRNSNSALPLQYRIAAVWGGHEGSLLLWVLMLCGWTVAVARFSAHLPQAVVARILAVMGLISCGLPALHAAHLQPVRAPASRPPPTAAT